LLLFIKEKKDIDLCLSFLSLHKEEEEMECIFLSEQQL